MLVLAIGVSWWFGGQSPGARVALALWGSVGIALFLILASRRELRPASPLVLHLAPLLLFDILVVTGCLNPSTRTMLRDGESFLVHLEPRWAWLPSSARPDLSWRELWQFNGIVLSCYNVCLAVRSRAQLRRLLYALGANVLALAVLGTFQKLAGSKGIWFGLVDVPQPYFFATFVYHNHWGAFILLHVAACAALFHRALNRGEYRDRWHSPLPAAAVAVLLIAATAPLSGSRSTTVLMAGLLAVLVARNLLRLVRRQRERRAGILLPAGALVLVVLLATAAIGYLSRDVIAARWRTTSEQLAGLRSEDRPSTRIQLYRDTWRMAMERPVFGWGLESFGDVFQIYNTQRAQELWFGQRVFREAHNDWLQMLAEVGVAGSACLIALGAAPFLVARGRRRHSALTRHLLAGCVIVLAYAWVEFPLANPSVMTTFWLLLYVAARHACLDAPVTSRQEDTNDA
ncbi:MAG: hypothetical protein C0502_00425 [Opitutus sp.]|nr:hypothetical protein [Opitutus sp.]